MLSSKCAMFDRFIKQQEASGILSRLGKHYYVKFLYLVLFCFKSKKWMKQ